MRLDPPFYLGSYMSSLITTCLILWQMTRVSGHGRLMDPPARNSMWRFGFPNTVNYNDNSLFCGGYDVQFKKNGGRCGVCGDAYHDGNPRPHEAGGSYAKGIISRQYRVGQEIEVEVELTANHWGRFEMYLCPNNNPKSEVTESCLERYPLYLAGTKDVAFRLSTANRNRGVFRYKVRLPPYLTCSQCVIRWSYFTEHLWGRCKNGTEDLGCAPSETFKNCADVSIGTGDGESGTDDNEVSPTEPSTKPSAESRPRPRPSYSTTQYPLRNQTRPYRPPKPVTTARTTTARTTTAATTTLGPYQTRPFRKNRPPAKLPEPIRTQVCLATPLFSKLAGADEWCQQRCVSRNPHCPPDMCYCPDTCETVGELAGRYGAASHCAGRCIVYPASKCPTHRCRCFQAKPAKENEVTSNFAQPVNYQPNNYQLNNYQPNYQPNSYQPNTYQPNNYQSNMYQPFLPNFYPYNYKK